MYTVVSKRAHILWGEGTYQVTNDVMETGEAYEAFVEEIVTSERHEH